MRELRDRHYAVLHTDRGKDGRTRRWYELFDAPQEPKTSVDRPTFGATCDESDLSRVSAGGTKRRQRTVGFPADKRERRSRNNSAWDALIEIVIHEIEQATGRTIGPRWAEKTVDLLLNGHSAGNPAGYIRAAIRNERDPRTRFLSHYDRADQQ